MAKLTAMVLECRLLAWAEGKDKRAAGQAGFCKDYRTTVKMYMMNSLINQSMKQGETLYCCFVEFRKAFDSIPRDTLWDTLSIKGLSNLTLSAIQSMYAKESACVLTQAGLTESFPLTKVKQGCLASPLLFGLYIDELAKVLAAAEVEIDAPELSGKLLSIPKLMSADDIALFSRSAEGLQTQLDILSKFCTPHGLQVNVKKTKVMVFERIKSPNPAFNHCQQHVEQVDNFRPLGIMFHSTKGLNCAVEQLGAAANKAIFAMLGRC